ncbi:hypothetical protein QJS10_CPA08g01287 [Acorus calamus]|uniref:Ribosome maturation factor RimP N-terminal domain-containing protein n=1 Tax=Acorus calamus TaxID=4465 RepID=A0AAV9EEW2_ACOCL|nr:hypothetical protein QJS10_CPA08g01287 [Acorus calamus]
MESTLKRFCSSCFKTTLCFPNCSSTSCPPHNFSLPFYPRKFPSFPERRPLLIVQAKKKSLNPQQVPFKDEELKFEEGEEEEEEEDGFESELIMGEDDEFDSDFEFEEEEEEEEAELHVGDGGSGGGISLAGTSWDKEALAIAEEVSISFGGDLKIFAFKTSKNSMIRVRIEKLSTKYGSPSMSDIEAFSTSYQARLDEASRFGTIPEDITLEVSSPGIERVIRVPEELDRFKEKPMYVKYISSDTVIDGVFKLVSFDLESGTCTWGLADVKINREKSGKGRPLSKKQKEWRLQTPFESLRLVRLYRQF